MPAECASNQPDYWNLCLLFAEGYRSEEPDDIEISYQFDTKSESTEEVMAHFASLGFEAEMVELGAGRVKVLARRIVLPSFSFLTSALSLNESLRQGNPSIHWTSAGKKMLLSKLHRERDELLTTLENIAGSSWCRVDRHCRAMPIGEKVCTGIKSYAIVGIMSSSAKRNWAATTDRILEIDQLTKRVAVLVGTCAKTIPPKPLICRSRVCSTPEINGKKWLSPFDT